jgi:hypothetical protein
MLLAGSPFHYFFPLPPQVSADHTQRPRLLLVQSSLRNRIVERQFTDSLEKCPK